jgi:hypothetical protein
MNENNLNFNIVKFITPDSPITDEDLNKLKKIIADIKSHPNSIPFIEPVNYKELGLVDYVQIIKKPMDLSTVFNNLVKNKCVYISEVLDDIQLIWDNCKTYNIEGSDIFVQAEIIEKYADSVIKRFYNAPKSKIINKKI